MYRYMRYVYVYVSVCLCLLVFVQTYKHTFVCNQRVSSWFLPIKQWPHDTSCTGHMMYGYKLLVAVIQRVVNKSSKEHSETG